MGAVKKAEFPWPLNDEFFEVAQNPVDWKYQVYVKCCNEYKNFKRYALIYGLEFNRAKFKLSYVKRDGDREREPYYLLNILGIKKKKYSSDKVSKRLENTSHIEIENGATGSFDTYDYYRYRICKYRFLMESLVESNTVYKDNFLLLKYLEVMLENAIKEDMQGKPISEAILIDKLDEKYEELKRFFPFAQSVNRMDVINNIRNRLVNGKAKKFSVLSSEERRYMMIRELFIHKKLENSKNVGVDIMQDKFPNYQELGRGGRDQLPCLSVMCTYADDLKFAFQRISKRVMTTEKIIGRWDSMFNNKLSIRDSAIIHINTAIKPNYHMKDEWDDRPVSDADMNWNIYVLLLLRRYGLIEIIDITNDNGIYIFSISIENDLLLNKGDEQTLLIEGIRSQEWAYYNEAYLTMERAITRSECECWSEMFFNTYDKVYEYCAGCNAHLRKNSGDTLAFPLKKSIKTPVSVVEMDQKKIFESQDELIVLARSEEKKSVIKFLESQRLSTLVATNSQLQEINFFESVSDGYYAFLY